MAPIFKAAFTALCCLAAAASANPIASHHRHQQRTPAPAAADGQTRECPASGEKQRITAPESWNIYPQRPDISRGPARGFEVDAFNNQSQLEQVFVFRGIPKQAKTCTLGWSQNNHTDRVFLVDGEAALVNVRPLSGLPTPSAGGDAARGEGITYAAIEPFDDAKKEDELNPDFTLWDDLDDDWDHIAGNVDCAEELAFKAALRDPQVKSHIYLESDEHNGIWLEYSC